MSDRIREYRPADEDAVAGVWHRSGLAAYTYLPTWQALTLERARVVFREHVLSRCRLWVGTRDQRVVAYLAMRGSYIDRLYVDPPHQRQGWGTRLLDHARGLSPLGLELHTHVENHSARTLYERYGFVAVRFGVSPAPESAPDVEYHWRPPAGQEGAAMTARLDGKVALVTGASRGVGKGIAIGLGEAGAEVWLAARTLAPPSPDNTATTSPSAAASGSLEETAREVEAAGGCAVAIACDLADDAQVERLFQRLAAERPRLDLLVNSAWGGYEGMVEDGEFTWSRPFWQQSMRRWTAMFDAGVRAAFACSRLAASRMVEQGSGLIVNVSFWAAQKYVGNTIYGAAKCATDRLTADMGRELASTGVTALALYPGLVRTEKVLEAAAFLDLSNSESPQFLGRAVAHLAADPRVGDRNGSVVVAAALAREYGFTDIDGRQPEPLTLEML